MLAAYCNLCENKKAIAKGKCKNCYNKTYWQNATEKMLEKRRIAVKQANIEMNREGYVNKKLRPKQSKQEKFKKAVECNRIRKLKRRAILNEIKLKSGCVDCGYNERAIALDFDHVNGQKSFNIARALGELRPFELILEEVMKCEVRCANCHRIATEDRLNGKLFF